MKSDTTIADALGIEPIEVEVEEVKESTSLTVTQNTQLSTETVNSHEAKVDFDLARKTYHTMIETGEGAVESMAHIANQSESSEAYKVLALLIKTTSDLTRDLFDLHRSAKELRGGPQRAADTNITVDKAVFVGTTDDLLQQVNANKERK